jgi:hypothetical protein
MHEALASVPTSTSSTSISDWAAGCRLSASHKKAIQILLRALRPLSNLSGSIPLPFVTTFLMVALNEGEGVCAYARMMGIHRAIMSRYLRVIGDRARNAGPGLGLVTVARHPRQPQRRQVLLTPKGRAIAEEIFRQMRRAEDSEISNLEPR